MKILSNGLILLLFVSACSSGSKTNKITIADKYSVELPEHLTETKDLNDEASLQYQNVLREFYTIVIDENKQELYDVIDESEALSDYTKNLNGFCKLVIDGMVLNAGMENQTIEKDQVINGLPAQILSTTLGVDGYEVFYKIAMIEGKNDFYQVMTWTLASNEETNKGEMEAILRSFSEK